MSYNYLRNKKSLLAIGMSTFLLIVGLSGCLEQPIESNIIYVDDGGGVDFIKIQDAIDHASDGDTVFVYAGTYSETLTINTSVHLVGESSDETLIDGQASIAAEKLYVIRVRADNCTIENFTIVGIEGESQLQGILIEAADTTVSHNHILFTDEAIYVDVSPNNAILMNTLTQNDYGIYFHYTSQNNISHNLISQNDDYGIYMGGSDDNTIFCNNISGNDDYGLRIKGSDNNKVIQNRIENNSKGLLFCCG